MDKNLVDLEDLNDKYKQYVDILKWRIQGVQNTINFFVFGWF